MLSEMIKPCLVEIAMNVHGTRAVQTLIEVLSKDVSLSENVLLGIIDYLQPQIKTLSLVSPLNFISLVECAWKPCDLIFSLYIQGFAKPRGARLRGQ